MDLQIDPEIEGLIPAQSAEEHQALFNSLYNNKFDKAFPIVTWKSIIIDGHNRYRICKELDIEFETVEKDFETREEVIMWIIDRQIERRNISPYYRRYLIGERIRLEKRQTPGRPKWDQVEPNNVNKSANTTAEKVAKESNASKSSGKRYEKYADATDIISENVGIPKGKLPDMLKASASDLKLLSELEPEKQKQAVDKVTEDGKNLKKVMNEFKPPEPAKPDVKKHGKLVSTPEKVTDQDVLVEIGEIPITSAEIARKIGIHRSNVAPRLKRLEKAGLIKNINGRWVLTEHNKSATIHGSRLTPTQIEFCEKLMYGEDDSQEVGEPADDAGIFYDLFANLRNIYHDNNFLELITQLAYENIEDDGEVDKLLAALRKEITGEPVQTIPGSRLTQDQIEFAETLFIHDDEYRCIPDSDAVDAGDCQDGRLGFILLNMRDACPKNELLSILVELIDNHGWSINNVDDDEAEHIAGVERCLAELRKLIVGESDELQEIITNIRAAKGQEDVQEMIAQYDTLGETLGIERNETTTQCNNVTGTRLTLAQLKMAELMFGVADSEDYGNIKPYIVSGTDATEAIELSIDNLYYTEHKNELILTLRNLFYYSNKYQHDEDAERVDELLGILRKIVTGEEAHEKPVTNPTNLTDAQQELAERIIGVGTKNEITDDVISHNIETVASVMINLCNRYSSSSTTSILGGVMYHMYKAYTDGVVDSDQLKDALSALELEIERMRYYQPHGEQVDMEELI